MDSLNVVVCGTKANACFASLDLASDWAVNPLSLEELSLETSFSEQMSVGKSWRQERPPGDPDRKLRPAYTPTLIIFFDDSINQATLCETLTANRNFHRHMVRVCVFCTPPQSINNELALQFNDFIFFPCAPTEFRLRLDLLNKQLNGPVADCAFSPVNQTLLEEFSDLNLRGRSRIFTDTLALIKQTARCDASVLIEGETGTGKENAARAVHYLGKRQDNAFVPINCGAIPDNLLESELFGHEKGAFTDARQKQAGLVTLANNGTLFLDEVDSLSPKAQAALLRFLQTGEYRPLGGGTVSQSNVRIIAATNANLAECVQRKEFREDLYFRLNVLYIRMPPLRERPEDIGVIADHLIKKFIAEHGNGPARIHSTALRELERRQWPGNVRELENVLLREFLLSSGDQIKMGDEAERMVRPDGHLSVSNAGTPGTLSFQEAKEAAISEFECSYLHTILALAEGNVTEAARLAGKERRCLGKLIKKYNIDKTKFIGHSAPA